MSYRFWSFTKGTNPISSNPYTCYSDTDYTFRDFYGEEHALYLGTEYTPTSGVNVSCPDESNARNLGDDPQVLATLPSSNVDGNNTSIPAPSPVKVYTTDGTVYTFNNSYGGGWNGGGENYSMLPTTIEDRNGNEVNVSAVGPGGGLVTVTDTAGRPVVSLNDVGNSNTLTVDGLAYQVTWASMGVNYSMPYNWISGPGSSYYAPDTTCNPPGGPGGGQCEISQIILHK